jgi:hypothetical protein
MASYFREKGEYIMPSGGHRSFRETKESHEQPLQPRSSKERFIPRPLPEAEKVPPRTAADQLAHLEWRSTPTSEERERWEPTSEERECWEEGYAFFKKLTDPKNLETSESYQPMIDNFQARFNTKVERRTKRGLEPATNIKRENFYRIISKYKGWRPFVWFDGKFYYRTDINPMDGIIKIQWAFNHNFTKTDRKIGETRSMHASEVISNQFILAEDKAVKDGQMEEKSTKITKIILNNVGEKTIEKALRPYIQNGNEPTILENQDFNNTKSSYGFFSIFYSTLGKAALYALKDANTYRKQQGATKDLKIESVEVHPHPSSPNQDVARKGFKYIIFNIEEVGIPQEVPDSVAGPSSIKFISKGKARTAQEVPDSVAGPSYYGKAYYAEKISKEDLEILDEHARNILDIRRSGVPERIQFAEVQSKRMARNHPNQYNYLQIKIKELEESEQNQNNIERNHKKQH